MAITRRIGVAGVFLASIALLTAACGSSLVGSPTARAGGSGTTSTTHPTIATIKPAGTSSPRPAQVPPKAPVPAGFQAGSVTFVSTTTGYVLGLDPSCAPAPHGCAYLVSTTDGGRTWTRVGPLPTGYAAAGGSSGGVSEVRFADPADGWAFGPDLLSTHDGGRTWQRFSVDGTVVALAASSGYVDALVSPCRMGTNCSGSLRLEQARAAGGPFSTVLTGPSGPAPSVSEWYLALHGTVGFAVLSLGEAPGHAVIYATPNVAEPGRWRRFPDPCAATGDALASLTAPDGTTLDSLCVGAGAAGSTGKLLVVTRDGKSIVAGKPPLAGDGGIVAAADPATVLLASASGASFIYRSTNGGRTWTTVEGYADGGAGFNDLGLTTGTQGVVVHGAAGIPHTQSQGGPYGLLMTYNSGSSWRAGGAGS